MAETNNFALKGIANLVQFGKRGLKILTDTDNDYFSFTDNNGSTLVEVRGADATQANAFFTTEVVEVLCAAALAAVVCPILMV